MEDYVFDIGPEEYFMDDGVDEIEDAEDSIFSDSGEDIDNVGDITDEVVDSYTDEDIYDRTLMPTYDDTCTEEDCDTIDYEVTGSEEEYDDYDDDEDDDEDIDDYIEEI